jgi:hypothetical protein
MYTWNFKLHKKYMLKENNGHEQLVNDRRQQMKVLDSKGD